MTRDLAIDRLLAGCDDEQREAITTDAAPLLIVAGAGSGKTRVLTRRIARRVADGSAAPARTLAITFTRRAAGELRARLHALGLPAPVRAGTFHSVALGELRRRAAERGDRPPVVLDSKGRLLARLLPDRYAIPSSGARPAVAAARRDVLGAIAAEIEWAKARLVPPERYAAAAVAAGRPEVVDAELVVSTYSAYEREKRRRRVLDFDDLLAELATAIEREPEFAASQRWRYRHLFVDELQDATAAQLRLLEAWLGGRDDLCAVGDPRQAIYGWSGGLSGAIDAFLERHPGARVVRLERNYRSSAQVVAVATSALGSGPSLVAPTTRDDGPVPTLRGYPSDEDEAAEVVASLRRARRPGGGWSGIAVLARTNAQLLGFEVACEAAGVPCTTGNAATLLSHPAVRSVLASVADADDSDAFVACVDDLACSLRSPDPADGGDEVAHLRSGDARDEFLALVELAREYIADDLQPTATGFGSWARAALRNELPPSSADAVTLSTFHRAKGLEWPVVFVTGLEDGFVPIASARTDAAVEEERRLLYVALSRAKEVLHCSFARTRRFGSRTVERSPSPYLAAIESVRRDLERMTARNPDAARAAIAAGRLLLTPRSTT